jgi:hypothetical protein
LAWDDDEEIHPKAGDLVADVGFYSSRHADEENDGGSADCYT